MYFSSVLQRAMVLKLQVTRFNQVQDEQGALYFLVHWRVGFYLYMCGETTGRKDITFDKTALYCCGL